MLCERSRQRRPPASRVREGQVSRFLADTCRLLAFCFATQWGGVVPPYSFSEHFLYAEGTPLLPRVLTRISSFAKRPLEPFFYWVFCIFLMGL